MKPEKLILSAFGSYAGRTEIDFTVLDYSEHALGEGSHAKAAAYIEMRDNRSGNITFGVGVSSNITRASIRGVFSAMNRLVKRQKDYV